MKQIWLVQTRCRNSVKPAKQAFLKIDTKRVKHGAGVVTGRFTLATLISCIISGPGAIGVSS